MMEWVRLKTEYVSEEKAWQAANIVATTEARLASEPHGPQYEVETRVEPSGDKWHVFWRKVFAGYGCGGGGCGSCGEQKEPPVPGGGKVLPFRKPTQ
jgi:hypothetical protein